MLSAEMIRKIKRIHIKSNRLANTMMTGQYKSVFKGAGIEFEEVREYSPGDEIKNIDWKVSARLGRPFVKQFREEREMVVMLLIDMSRSGKFGTGDSLKIEKAAEIASVLAFNAIKNGDKVGVIFFTDKVEKYIPPKKGSSHIWRVIREIFAFDPEGAGTDIAEAVRFLGKVERKKTVSFVISDFLSGDYMKQMRVVSGKHEIINVLLSDPGDFTLPESGIFLAEDFETGRQVMVDLSNKKSRQACEINSKKRYRGTLQEMKRNGTDVIEMSTAGSVTEALVRYFMFREKRIR